MGFQPSGTGPAESARDVAPPPPALSVTPTSLSFNTVAGSNPAAKPLSVAFSSGTPGWTAASSQAWIQVSPTSGTGAGTVNVSINAAALAAGNHSGSVTLTSPGSQNSPVTISVNLVVAPADPPRTEFYVAPTGTSGGDGTIGRPWDIFTAMAHPAAVKPGGTIWVRGGEYGDHNTVLRVSLVGTLAAPIIVRAYQGERAVIRSYTQVGCCDDRIVPEDGSYVWIWGLEFTSPVVSRTGKLPGLDVFALRAKLINNVIHDTQQGIGFWRSALNGEAHGNIIYNNGYNDIDRGHGHGIYSQNDTGVKQLTDNIVFNQFGWGLHLYGTSNSEVRNYNIQGNISFNNGILSGERSDNIILAGGASGLSGMTVQHNHFYMTPEAEQGNNQIGWLFSSSNVDAVVSDNYFIGGRFTLVAFGWKFLTMVRNRLYSRITQVWLDTRVNGTANVVWGDNIYHGASNFNLNGQVRDFNGWKTATGFDVNASFTTSAPTGTQVVVRKNQCEEGRGHVVVYNWNSAASVPVDVSSILAAGMRYEIRDVQNFYGAPVLSGTYGGGSLSLPMNLSTVALAHGGSVVAPVHTAPRFGVFVVLIPGGGRKVC